MNLKENRRKRSFKSKKRIHFIVESLKKSGLLIDGASETVKHDIKKQEGGFLWAMMAIVTALLIAPMNSSLIQPVPSLLVNTTSGRRVTRAG